MWRRFNDASSVLFASGAWKDRSNLVGTISRAGVSHGGIPTRMASEREDRERKRVRDLRQICENRVARLYSASNGMVSPNRTRKRWGRHNKNPWDNLNLSCRVWTKNLIDRLGQPGGRGKGFSTAGPGGGRPPIYTFKLSPSS